MSKRKIQSGFSLVETIIYISLMIVMLSVLFYLISSAYRTYSILRSSRNIERSAMYVMGGINDIVNKSSKIDTVGTKFDDPLNGSISLISKDNLGNSTTSRIYLENNRVILSENNSIVGELSLSDVNVKNLIFKNMSTSTINGFKVEMLIDNASSTSEKYISEKFYDSYILK